MYTQPIKLIEHSDFLGYSNIGKCMFGKNKPVYNKKGQRILSGKKIIFKKHI